MLRSPSARPASQTVSQQQHPTSSFQLPLIRKPCDGCVPQGTSPLSSSKLEGFWPTLSFKFFHSSASRMRLFLPSRRALRILFVIGKTTCWPCLFCFASYDHLSVRVSHPPLPVDHSWQQNHLCQFFQLESHQAGLRSNCPSLLKRLMV